MAGNPFVLRIEDSLRERMEKAASRLGFKDLSSFGRRQFERGCEDAEALDLPRGRPTAPPSFSPPMTLTPTGADPCAEGHVGERLGTLCISCGRNVE